MAITQAFTDAVDAVERHGVGWANVIGWAVTQAQWDALRGKAIVTPPVAGPLARRLQLIPTFLSRPIAVCVAGHAPVGWTDLTYLDPIAVSAYGAGGYGSGAYGG